MLTEATQLEVADLKDRCRNFRGESTGHEQRPADILAEKFQPAEDVDVAADGGEVEAIARANVAICGIAMVQSDIDGDMLLELRRQSLQRTQRCLRRSQGRLAGRCRIIAGDWKDCDDRVTDILEDVASAPGDTGDDQIEEGIKEFNNPFLRKFICKSAEPAQISEQHRRLDVVDVAALD